MESAELILGSVGKRMELTGPLAGRYALYLELGIRHDGRLCDTPKFWSADKIKNASQLVNGGKMFQCPIVFVGEPFMQFEAFIQVCKDLRFKVAHEYSLACITEGKQIQAWRTDDEWKQFFVDKIGSPMHASAHLVGFDMAFKTNMTMFFDRRNNRQPVTSNQAITLQAMQGQICPRTITLYEIKEANDLIMVYFDFTNIYGCDNWKRGHPFNPWGRNLWIQVYNMSPEEISDLLNNQKFPIDIDSAYKLEWLTLHTKFEFMGVYDASRNSN